MPDAILEKGGILISSFYLPIVKNFVATLMSARIAYSDIMKQLLYRHILIEFLTKNQASEFFTPKLSDFFDCQTVIPACLESFFVLRRISDAPASSAGLRE
jgi:hypothetical protein